MSTNKTIGTTTLASTGGGTIGFFVAQFIVDLFHLQLSDGGQMGLGLLLVAVGSLIGGYLSPSKHEEVTRALAQANIPTKEEVVSEVAQVIPSAVAASKDAIADAVVQKQTQQPASVAVPADDYFTADAGVGEYTPAHSA